MKDKKILRPLTEETETEYAQWAEWCNQNGYRIMDDNLGFYYCVSAQNETLELE